MPRLRAAAAKALKRILFAIIPLLILLLAAESVLRVKYFVMHDYDWNYLTMPFQVQDAATVMERIGYNAPEPSEVPIAGTDRTGGLAPRPSEGPITVMDRTGDLAPQPSEVPIADTDRTGGLAPQPSGARIVDWHRPCRDREV